MGNTINLLLEYGWKPHNYHTWQTHESEWSFTLNDLDTSPKYVINSFLDRVNEIDASRAECHYCGEGMSGGIDWHNSKIWHRSNSISYAQKCVLEVPSGRIVVFIASIRMYLRFALDAILVLSTLRFIVFGAVRPMPKLQMRLLPRRKNS